MLKRIESILQNIDQVSAWKINEKKVASEELFFIKQALDMNRSKDVHEYSVTVFTDFREGDDKYRGSSTTVISPTMTEDEIKNILEDTAFAASFVKNKHYDIAKPDTGAIETVNSQFAKDDLGTWMPKISEAIFKHDTQQLGGINSAEVFLNRYLHRVVNSEGINVSFEQFVGEVEIVTEWNEGKEAIELFDILNFSDYQPDKISDRVLEMINESKERSQAIMTPALKSIPVILTGEAVKDFFAYYVNKASAQTIYEKTSDYKINDKIQGEAAFGDLLTLKLLPNMENSSKSKPYDMDGQRLKPLTIIEEGILKDLHGPIQYTSYLGLAPKGNMSNYEVSCGTKSIESFKSEPYIEIVSFSAFQMHPITGDFGGELRLARYFDGNKVIPVTGGSLSANINDVHNNMLLSKEGMQINNYKGPKAIKLFDLDIAGQ